jgi:hypothetical protein
MSLISYLRSLVSRVVPSEGELRLFALILIIAGLLSGNGAVAILGLLVRLLKSDESVAKQLPPSSPT